MDKKFTEDELVLYQYQFCKEELSNIYMGWLLQEAIDYSQQQRATVIDFIEFAQKDLNSSIHEPRAKDGLSFYQRVHLLSSVNYKFPENDNTIESVHQIDTGKRWVNENER